MELHEDNNILHWLKAENPLGYRAMFDKYYKQLCIQACLLLNDDAAAEDLVQDVFIRFWQDKTYLQVQTSLGAYLSVSVRNRAINQLKKNKRTPVVGDEFLEEQALGQAPLSPLELQEMGKVLNQAIEGLPEQCRKIFEMVCLDGKKYKEASDLAGVSVNTVKTQLRRALSRLREQLSEIRHFALLLSPILEIILSYKK